MTITIDDSISDAEALNYVLAHVRGGRISEHKGKPIYCWATCFAEVDVLTRPLYGSESDRFVVLPRADNPIVHQQKKEGGVQGW
jgi:hypothetical protein